MGAREQAGPVAGGPQVAVSGVGLEEPRERNLHFSAPSDDGGVSERDETTSGKSKGITRAQMNGTPKNAPCPCGSGKKFKMCHGRQA